jgi:hypothetical protein
MPYLNFFIFRIQINASVLHYKRSVVIIHFSEHFHLKSSSMELGLTCPTYPLSVCLSVCALWHSFTSRSLKDIAKDPEILSLLPQHQVGPHKERRAAFEIFCEEISEKRRGAICVYSNVYVNVYDIMVTKRGHRFTDEMFSNWFTQSKRQIPYITLFLSRQWRMYIVHIGRWSLSKCKGFQL